MSAQAPLVKCPTCATPVPWSPDSKWRPFCSERCKTIDLGAWASEAYRIPVDESADDESPRVPGPPDDTALELDHHPALARGFALLDAAPA